MADGENKYENLFPNEPNRIGPGDFDAILAFCNTLDASDITFQSGEPIMAECHGRLLKITNRNLTTSEVGEIINAIYGPNGTTQLLSGKDIDTHYEFRPNRSERYRYRINGTACLVEGYDGIQITARSIPTDPPALSTMNLPKEIIDAMAPHQGIVYVTGATGSGKSTLLAAIIKELAEDPESHRKVLTYESPIEFVYDSIKRPTAIISQSEIPRHLPSFAAGVRNALRRKPRLILVGESRDAETISASLEAALTGHPVYTTLHTNGVAEAIRRLVTSFPAEERHGRTIDIIETVRLIIWQKLVPTVDGKRVALREYLVFDETIRDQLLDAEPDNVTAITRQLVKDKGQPMIVEAERCYKEGIISDREYRVLVAGSKNSDLDTGIA